MAGPAGCPWQTRWQTALHLATRQKNVRSRRIVEVVLLLDPQRLGEHHDDQKPGEQRQRKPQQLPPSLLHAREDRHRERDQRRQQPAQQPNRGEHPNPVVGNGFRTSNGIRHTQNRVGHRDDHCHHFRKTNGSPSKLGVRMTGASGDGGASWNRIDSHRTHLTEEPSRTSLHVIIAPSPNREQRTTTHWSQVAPFGIRTMPVELGFFRTELLTPPPTQYAEPSLEDYADRTRQTVEAWQGICRAGKAGADDRPARGASELDVALEVEHARAVQLHAVAGEPAGQLAAAPR